MIEEVRVISNDLDGGQLVREMYKNRYYTRCVGKKDNEEMQDAFGHIGKSQFCLSIERRKWDKIFGSS